MKLWLLANFVVVLSFLAVTFFIQQQDKNVIVKRHQTAQTQAHTKAAQIAIDATNQQLATLKDKQDLLNQRLLNSKDIETFFTFVDGLASKYHATATFAFGGTATTAAVAAPAPSSSPGASPAPAVVTVSPLSFSLSITAPSSDALTGFINDLEHSRYIIVIDTLNISSVDKSSAQATLGFKLYVQNST